MSASPGTPTFEGRGYRIGYALTGKKVQTFIRPSLVDHAKQNGVDLVPVDLGKPLIEQGFFNCIVHKLYGQDWIEQLREYASKYPNSVIIDPPDRIQRVHSRISMVEAALASRLKIPQLLRQEGESLLVPKQVVVEDSEGLTSPELGVKFPVIAKPVEADGNATSHEMYLVINSKGLKNLRTPIVLQEFVNHGGVVFKVYVVGEQVKCVKRRSLPDIPIPDPEEEQISSELKPWEEEGRLAFSQISNTAAQSDEKGNVENSEMPSVGFVEAVGRALREELGLHLFNFDLIRGRGRGRGYPNPLPRPVHQNHKYFVIDVNYFPGFDKMPCFEQVLTEFFLKCCRPTPSLTPNTCMLEDSKIQPSPSTTKEEAEATKQEYLLFNSMVSTG